MAGVAFAVEGDGVGFATESYAASALYTTLANLSADLWRIRWARYGDYFRFALLLVSGIGSAGAWLRHYLNRDERQENTSHRNRILAMVSGARTAASDQELLAMQREVDAIIGDTLECYDDGAIEEEELAAFGLVLELFNHAIGERRAALQAGTLEPARVTAVGSSLTSLR
jgi:hypothetical protein